MQKAWGTLPLLSAETENHVQSRGDRKVLSKDATTARRTRTLGRSIKGDSKVSRTACGDRGTSSDLCGPGLLEDKRGGAMDGHSGGEGDVMGVVKGRGS